MPILSTLLHATHFTRPLLSTLVPTVALAFTLQGLTAIPSIALQTERFYDLSGSLTYLSCTALSLYLPFLRARQATLSAGLAAPPAPSILAALRGAQGAGLNWRQVFLSAAVAAWASRLGSYLFKRISGDGGRDSRFDGLRGSPPKMLGAFGAQAMWVSLCLMPVIAVNALPAATFASLPAAVTLTDLLGVGLWVGGFGFEVVADMQKNRWVADKKAKKHSEEFLTSGLWSKSRHPNYFGESTLWTGVAALSAGVLLSGPGQVGLGLAGLGALGKVLAGGMCAVSPAFVSFLLLKVSGVPMSEEKYDKRYGVCIFEQTLRFRDRERSLTTL